jgi:hypothetical protein
LSVATNGLLSELDVVLAMAVEPAVELASAAPAAVSAPAPTASVAAAAARRTRGRREGMILMLRIPRL